MVKNKIGKFLQGFYIKKYRPAFFFDILSLKLDNFENQNLYLLFQYHNILYLISK